MALTKIGKKGVTAVLPMLKRAGGCFVIGSNRHTRYFPSEIARDHAVPAVTALAVARALANKRAAQQRAMANPVALAAKRLRDKVRHANKRKARKLARDERRAADALLSPPTAKPAKPPRPVKAPPVMHNDPKHPARASNPTRVHIVIGAATKKPVPVKWADLPAVTPAHVKKIVCPSGKDDRFTAPASHVGEFTKQWRQLRSAA